MCSLGQIFSKICSSTSNNLLYCIKRLYTQESKKIGLVSGFVFTGKSSVFNLSPALSYIDEVFLNHAIRERISNGFYLKNAGTTDHLSSTFLMANHTIVFSSMYHHELHQKCSESSSISKLDSPSMWSRLSTEKIQSCVGKCVQILQRQGFSEILVDPFFNSEAASEAAHLAVFRFDELKNPKHHLTKPQLSCLTAHLDSDPDSVNTKKRLLQAWNRGSIMAQSQNLARRWMEMPANLFPPTTFANTIQETFSQLPLSGGTELKVVIRDREWCLRQNMGGILGVSAGSNKEPAFVEIIYTGDLSRRKEHIALVGKGVTFDAGGISLKPSPGMEDMRADMGGAAVVAATVFGLANLLTPINIRAYLPLVENMPDGGSIRPGDVLKLASGTSVQVDNTDAEGRLILADALYFAQNNPDALGEPLFVMDVATLTGAISTALGDRFTGLFCNAAAQKSRVWRIWPTRQEVDISRDVSRTSTVSMQGLSIIKGLSQAGFQKNDPFWHMPCLYSKQLRECCHLADISNVTSGPYARLGGSGSAASFLQNFVNINTPFIHLDIAGVMKSSVESPCLRRGMTGRPTRSLIHFFDSIARGSFDFSKLPLTIDDAD